MRRLPVYFLIDVSESMVGDPIEEVQNGMRTIIQELRTDPYALETVFVSIIAFAGRTKTLTPLTELYAFYPPTFPIGGGTSLGNALNTLMDDIDRNVQKTTQEVKGDWKPIIFLFTDGTPTDNYQEAFRRWNNKYRRGCNMIAISIGDNVNHQLLGQLTENVLLLKNTNAEGFKQFFKWVTASIRTSSMAVADEGKDELRLPSIDGVNIEKADLTKPGRVDENFVVVLGKCQKNKRNYLMKYARKFGNIEDIENIRSGGFTLVGAYAIPQEGYDELSDPSAKGQQISVTQLYGAPTCPCCGNQYAFLTCGSCGKNFCAGEERQVVCPWCGTSSRWDFSDEDYSVDRTIG